LDKFKKNRNRVGSRPHRRHPNCGRRRLAHTHGFAATISCPSFLPPHRHHPPPHAALRGTHHRRSYSVLLLPFTPHLCSSRHADANCCTVLSELHPRAPPLHCLAGQASAASSARRCLEPPPQPLFPGRRTPPTVKLLRLPSHSVNTTPMIIRALATFPSHELLTTQTSPLTAVPLRPSRALVETAPPVSPPLRCAFSRFPTVPCSSSTPPRPTLPLVAARIDRPLPQ
jgi:hypothetical protein